MKKQITSGAIKAALVSALAIGVFSAAFIGVNSLALAAATSGTTTIPPTELVVGVPENLPPEGFTAPNITVIEIPFEFGEVSAHAMSAREAAQIGAQYIYDVFGSSIDGMYVQMIYSHPPAVIGPNWIGTVARSPQALESRLDVRGTPNENFAPLYRFAIDAVTGSRVNVSQQGAIDRGPLDRDAAMAARYAMRDTGWFDMNLTGQLEFLGVSAQSVASYRQTARTLAERHFNNTSVTSIELTRLSAEYAQDGMSLLSLVFTATDNTGREAEIMIPSGGSRFRMIHIQTSHNDIIPGFVFDGLGIG
jgi:hypothetical protein